jgi:genome maintenance exonuclease 1
MSPQSMAALDKWKKLKITQLGEEGFKSYQKNLLNRGKSLHLNIKNFLQARDSTALTITENISNLWKSIEPVFSHINEVKLRETPISHPYLCYKGIVDCVAVFNGKLVIIEWKTSEKLKPTLNHIYDNPLQAVAYLGAINYELNHCLRATEIVLVYAYEDGSNAQIHHLNCDQCHQYWKQWLNRLKSYWDVIAFKQTLN